MKNSDIYDAVSGIEEKYRTRSEDFEGIAAAFRRARIRRAEKIISFAASMVLVIFAGLNIYDKNDIINQSSMIGSSYTKIKPSEPAETTISSETADSSPTSASKLCNENTSKGTSGTAVSTYNYVTSYDDKLKETAPGFPASDVNAVQTVPVTSKPSENNVSDKPVSSVSVTRATSESKPEGSQAPVPDTTTVTDKYDTSADPTDPPLHWEEMDINEKFFGCDFEGLYYQSLKLSVDSALVGDCLGEAEMSGYDSYTDTYYHCKAKMYSIGNNPENDIVAVMFDGDDRCFLYINYRTDN